MVLISMICPKCNHLRPEHHNWTDAQWNQKKPNVGGRNECQSCWTNGPTTTDWSEVQERLRTISGLERQNHDLRYQHFMKSFLKQIGASRKNWSYHGVLPVRFASDPSTKLHEHVLDPTNYVYSCVMKRAVPDIKRLMGWADEPNWSTMGDCIESLLAYDDAGGGHEWNGVTTHDGAGFFREMSYNYFRIHRVLEWDWHTARTRSTLLHEVLPPRRYHMVLGRCLCGHVSVPHQSTMRCSVCGLPGCAMIIHLYRPKLYCGTCKAIVQSMPTRDAP